MFEPGLMNVQNYARRRGYSVWKSPQPDNEEEYMLSDASTRVVVLGSLDAILAYLSNEEFLEALHKHH